MSTKCEVQAQLLTCSRPDSQTLSWSKPLGLRRRIKVSSSLEKIENKGTELRKLARKNGKESNYVGSLKWYNGLRRAWVNEVCGHM